jgi:hypothetical protein
MQHDKDCTRGNQYPGALGHLLSWKGFVFTLGLATFSYYLLSAHWEHLALALPYLILLACPLMHIFGHGHHHSANSDEQRSHKPHDQ